MNAVQIDYLAAKIDYKAQSAKYNHVSRAEYDKSFTDLDYINARDSYYTAKENLLNWGFALLNNLKPGAGTELQQLYAADKLFGDKLDQVIDLTLRVKS